MNELPDSDPLAANQYVQAVQADALAQRHDAIPAVALEVLLGAETCAADGALVENWPGRGESCKTEQEDVDEAGEREHGGVVYFAEVVLER